VSFYHFKKYGVVVQQPDQTPQEPVAPSNSHQAQQEVSQEQAPKASAPRSTAPQVLHQTTRSGVVFERLPSHEAMQPEVQTTGPVDNPCVNQEFETSTEPVPLRDNKEINKDSKVCFFFSERGEHVDARIANLATSAVFSSTAGQDWNSSIQAAGQMSAYEGMRFEDSLRRTDSKWMQYLATESGKIGYSSPRVAEEGSTKYSGQKAMLRVRALLGRGGIVTVPLYHSGFTITLKAPSDGALIELRRRLKDEKIFLGRDTAGLVFSNEQAYIIGWVIDFCLDHLFETSAKVEDPDMLKTLIKAPDINMLLWGLACLIWPAGFNYVRALTTAEGIASQEVISGKINISKLLWVDNHSFTAKQKSIIARRTRNAVTTDMINEYQQEFNLSAGRRIDVSENLAVVLKMPSIADYVEDGARWISNIVQIVDSTFTQTTPDQNARNEAIEMHSRATRLRRYGSWISHIVVDDQEINELDVILDALEAISATPGAASDVEKKIEKFIDDCVVSMIAIPETSGRETGLPRFPHLIPMDAVNVFFILLGQHIELITRE
jgi:hypothetical protein